MTCSNDFDIGKHRAADRIARCAVLTVSDSRDAGNDRSGDLIVERIEAAGHQVVERDLCSDDIDAIQGIVKNWIASDQVDVVITTGGTGIAKRDVTPEALEPLFDRELPGFGELFRMLSFEQVGAAAMLSRATAGVSRRTPCFALPGSPQAATLAMDQLIVPELGHLVGLLRSGV